MRINSHCPRLIAAFTLHFLTVLLLAVPFTVRADEGHPRILASDGDREVVWRKIRCSAWAEEIYERLCDKIDPYADRHGEDPEWIVSRLAMYWKEGEHFTQCYLQGQNWARGEGNAPVPTVRLPGMRIWNDYTNVPLADRIPYNETGDMWGLSRSDPSADPVLVPYQKSGHMIRGNNVEILSLAEEAAFLWWLTGEEAYGAFAADIFNTWLLGTFYMEPVLDPEESTGGPGGYEPGGICGYYDYEQIHDDLVLHGAMVYDFLYDYLCRHPHPHFAQLGMSLTEVAGVVFKRFIEIGFVRGGKEGNWNVNGWNIMLRAVLALEDDDQYDDGRGRSYYLHYLTEESTPYHDALPDMVSAYDSVTGLWPEAPGYAFGTVATLLDFAVLLQRQGVDVMEENPILQKAAMAIFPWMDARGKILVFGDTRGGSANFLMFERLLTYYTHSGNAGGIAQAASALRKGLASGSYQRGGADWTALCTFVADVPEPTPGGGEDAAERMSWSPFHRVVTMKSGHSGQEELMAVLNGGRNGAHLSANGLALQLYGFGYALSPDAAGYESYWSEDKCYHQSPTGSNTILPGYMEGEVVIRAMEPRVEEGQFIDTIALSPTLRVCDMEAGEKRRVVALLSVSGASGGGYYVDIFRSRQMENDYLMHNVGLSLSLEDAYGQPLPLDSVDSIGRTYGEGYRWFTNLCAADYEGDYRAVWTISEGEESLSMRMWMAGGAARTLYVMDAPHTTLNKDLTPFGVSVAPSPTPTLLVRQQQTDGWAQPFVSVHEPVRGDKACVREVTTVVSDTQRVVLCVRLDSGRVDHIICGTSSEVTTQPCAGMTLTGMFALVSEQDGEVCEVTMVEGTHIGSGRYHIEADAPCSASLTLQNGKWVCSCTAPVRVRLGRKTYTFSSGYRQPFP